MLWQHPEMTRRLRYQHHWIFCVAALAVWVTLGWPILHKFVAGTPMRGAPIPSLWVVAFVAFGMAILCASLIKPRAGPGWLLISVQLASVIAMAALLPWAMMSVFLVIIAWQVAMATSARNALAWVAFQTLAIIATLAQALNPDLCYIVGLSLALQLCFVFTALALRREVDTARTLARTNRDLHAAQAVIANTVRDAERLRISRELHDAWGHELTALGLQLEIASHLSDPARVGDHVGQAKDLSRALLGKVRDVVATLRDDERSDLKGTLEALARSVPSPAIHVDVAPAVQLAPEQAHAFIRCAQEAVTNSVRHARAANLWLQVTMDADRVRLIARDDGDGRLGEVTAGSGLRGMRERLEHLGGELAVGRDAGRGFMLNAWLPIGPAQTA